MAILPSPQRGEGRMVLGATGRKCSRSTRRPPSPQRGEGRAGGQARRLNNFRGAPVTYQPEPIDTSRVRLPVELEKLIEQLARNTHEHWALGRLATGWTWGERRDDARKEHPCLVPYPELPDSEKALDRTT